MNSYDGSVKNKKSRSPRNEVEDERFGVKKTKGFYMDDSRFQGMAIMVGLSLNSREKEI